MIRHQCHHHHGEGAGRSGNHAGPAADASGNQANHKGGVEANQGLHARHKGKGYRLWHQGQGNSKTGQNIVFDRRYFAGM